MQTVCYTVTNVLLSNQTLHYSKTCVKRPLSKSFCLFVMLLYVPSQQLWSWRDSQFTEPHFFLGRLEQAVNQYFVHILSLVTDKTLLE